MKILLAPSEAKSSTLGSKNFSLSNLIFGSELLGARSEVLRVYEEFINHASFDKLCEIFGSKDEKMVEYFKSSFKANFGIKAGLRYSGVAFGALGYKGLSSLEQNFIDKNVVIFSNLFGILRPSDIIPDYKLKQGFKFPNFELEKFYNSKISPLLDEFLKDEEILDLRPSYYDKFYKIKSSFTTLKFIKNGKVVSHYAKFYRGFILRNLAKNGIDSLEKFENLALNGLKIIDIKMTKNKKEINLEIQN